jgi:hypothetical protein
MRAPKSGVITSFVIIGALSLIPSVALTAKMTREQARAECLSETPRVGRGDKGNSRGFVSATNPIRDCVKAKMSKK